MTANERELDRLWTETTNLGSAVEAIRREFSDLRTRFNLVIVASSLLSLVVGGLRLFECFQGVVK